MGNDRFVRMTFDANSADGSAYMEPADVVSTWTSTGVIVRINTYECYTTTHITLVMDDETARAVRRGIANAFSRRRRELAPALCADQTPGEGKRP